MRNKKNKTRKMLWGSVIALFALIASLLCIDLVPYFQFLRLRKAVHELAPIGSDWSKASMRIESAGYSIEPIRMLITTAPFPSSRYTYVADCNMRRTPLIIIAVNKLGFDVQFGRVRIEFNGYTGEVFNVEATNTFIPN